MTKDFDDYDFKNISKRIKFSLKQTTESFLSPWELSSFVSNFNTYYYKAEVINTIGIVLNQNILPKNILIFDESFKLNQQYTKLSKISLKDNDLKYLYTLGKPISLTPNKDIIVLNILFKYFRQLNEFLYKMKRKTLDSNNLKYYFKYYRNDTFENLIKELKSNSKYNLRKTTLNEENLKIFNNIFLLMKNEYDNFDNKQESIELINNKLKLENWSNEIDKNDNIYKNYFTRFYSLLRNIQRPVIAVYNEKSQTINILCRAHINKKQRNAVTLDLKSISHNSPIEAVFNAGISAVSTYKEQKRADELHEFDKELKELEILKEKKLLENLEVDLEIKKAQLLRQKIEIMKEVQSLENSHELNAVKTIENPYLKEQIVDVSSTIHKKSIELLYRHNFEVNDLAVIDIKV